MTKKTINKIKKTNIDLLIFQYTLNIDKKYFNFYNLLEQESHK